MTQEVLYQDECYEWAGRFWFPSENNEECKIFSGKLSYNPDNGIRLTLVTSPNTPALLFQSTYKKIMHAIAFDDGLKILSLINVHLASSHLISATTATARQGRAKAIVLGAHIDSLKFKKLSFEYDPSFENVLFGAPQTQNQSLELSKTGCITTNNGTKISYNFHGSGSMIDTMDDIMWSDNEEYFSNLKKIINDFKSKNKLSLFNYSKIYRTVSFELENQDLFYTLKQESNWRLFWKLLIDDNIFVKSMNVYVEETLPNNIKLTRKPILIELPKNRRKTYLDTNYNLPITLTTLTLGSTKFSSLSEIISKWMNISQSDDWNSIIHFLEEFIETNHRMVNKMEFSSLISHIETFLDLIGTQKTNTDTLVKLYSHEKWAEGMKAIAKNLENETIGHYIHSIRNAIVHPKSATKKNNGKYKKISDDSLVMQKLYSYISGILVKGILQHINIKPQDSLERYTDFIIERHSSFTPVTYED